jgi:hypothetical protein
VAEGSLYPALQRLLSSGAQNPAVQGGDISDLAATSQGSLLLLNVRFRNVRFQDVDWGSTTRRSEVRWRPEGAKSFVTAAGRKQFGIEMS